MSVTDARWAMQQVLPPSHALALRTIAVSINPKERHGWMSQKRMAEDSNDLGWATFKRCLKDLRALGLVTVTTLTVNGRRLTAYQVNRSACIRWNKKAIKWRAFLAQEIARRAQLRALPNESPEEHVSRLFKLRGIKR